MSEEKSPKILNDAVWLGITQSTESKVEADKQAKYIFFGSWISHLKNISVGESMRHKIHIISIISVFLIEIQVLFLIK